MARFPAIADYLLDGRLSLTRLCWLRELLTQENHQDLLERATLGTERDAEAFVASLKPKPDVSDSIRRLPTRATKAVPAIGDSAPAPQRPAVPVTAASAPPRRLAPAASRSAQTSAPTPAHRAGRLDHGALAHFRAASRRRSARLVDGVALRHERPGRHHASARCSDGDRSDQRHGLLRPNDAWAPSSWTSSKR